MPSVPILVYHKVDEPPEDARYPQLYVPPTRFAAQLALLRRLGRRPVTLARYVAYRHGEAELPPLPVVVTFDDGYRSNYQIAFPMLTSANVPATIFVVPGLLGRTNEWDADAAQEPLLDAGAIREMQRAGIDFQSHTRTHARLPALPARDALAELRDSREALEDLLGARVDAVAYPWGDHDPSVMRLAQAAGYRAGAAVRRRMNFDHTPLFALRRIEVSRDTTLRRLAWDLLRLPFHRA